MSTLSTYLEGFKLEGVNAYLHRHRRKFIFEPRILDKLSDEDIFNFANILQADAKDLTIYKGEDAQVIYKNYIAAFTIIKERKQNPALSRDVTDTAAVFALKN